MDKQTMLLNAAKAMGLKFHSYVDNPMIGCGINIGDCETPIWNPLESSADCAEMEDALDIDVNTHYTVLSGTKSVQSRHVADDDTIYHEELISDHPSKGAARRYASTMVAAMIGAKL